MIVFHSLIHNGKSFIFFSPLYRRFDMTHLFGFIVYSLFRIIKLGSMHLFISYLTKYGYFGRIYSDKFENYTEIYR